jgi:hypothetical protein
VSQADVCHKAEAYALGPPHHNSRNLIHPRAVQRLQSGSTATFNSGRLKTSNHFTQTAHVQNGCNYSWETGSMMVTFEQRLQR